MVYEVVLLVVEDVVVVDDGVLDDEELPLPASLCARSRLIFVKNATTERIRTLNIFRISLLHW